MLGILDKARALEQQISRFQKPERTEASPRWQGISSVRDSIRELSPKFEVPEHLAPYLDFLDRAVGHNLDEELVFHAPPQHGKTEALAHGFPYWAANFPGFRHAYATYNEDRAMEIKPRVQHLCFEAGLDPHTRKGLMTLTGGTEIKFTSATGSLTGRPIDGILAVDDPIKNAEDARSKRHRDANWRFLAQTCDTRLHPGASKVIMMTRWHPDDLAGRCIADGFTSVRLPAIAENADDPLGRKTGEALWPERRPIDFLRKKMKRLGRNAAAAMYQGRPQADGAEVFEPCTFYAQLPPKRFQVAYGLDCAYSAKSSADYSVLVRMLRIGNVFYVPNIWRRQERNEIFTERVKRERAKMPGRVRWYANSLEQEVAKSMRRTIPYLESPLASSDKFIRALPMSTAHNDQRVLFLKGAPWVADVVEELGNFTGQDDAHDDIVDALAAAFDVLDKAPAYEGPNSVVIPPRM